MFYIILPVHNRIAITSKFIDCLKKQTRQDYHLLLVDDGSIDGTQDMVKDNINNLTVLNGNGELWWAGSLQAGINHLKNKIKNSNPLILLINDDVTFGENYLENAEKLMDPDNKILLLSQFIDEEGNITETGVNFDNENMRFATASNKDKINCLSTRGLFIYWKNILDIGDFYPKLLPHYLSDYEYTIRAYKKGYQCKTDVELLINPMLEGRHEKIKYGSFFSKLKYFFSKKYHGNPVYWSIFIWLVGDWKRIPTQVIRKWINFCYLLLK